jgi:DNA-binding transcriptional ArsR family regulator
MDIPTAVRTILVDCPIGIKPKLFIRELCERTGKSRSVVYYHLSSLEDKEFVKENGRYHSISKRLWEEEKKHKAEIITGLLALRGKRYHVTGMPIPNWDNANLALKHLRTGYQEIYGLVPSEIGRFQEEAEGLAQGLIGGSERLKGYCDICGKALGKEFSVEEESQIRERLKLFG